MPWPAPHPVRVRIYDFIIRYKSEHDGNSPSIRQIAEVIGDANGPISTSVVNYHLNMMATFGMIKRSTIKGQNRMIIVIGGKWIGPNMIGRS